MDVAMMRRIDRMFGVPLCAAATVLRRAGDLLFPSRRGRVQKILLIKLSEMGALTLTYPLLMFLRKTYPGVSFSFLVFERNAASLALLRDCVPPENIVTVRDDTIGHFAASALGALGRIRRERFDAVIDLEFFARGTALMAFLSGAPRRVGFFRYHLEGLYRGDLLTHKVAYNPLLHCSRSYLCLGKALNQDRMTTPTVLEPIGDEEMVFPHFSLDPSLVEAARKRLCASGIVAENIYLLNPGDGILPVREWPLEKFISLACRILQDPQSAIVLVGKNAGTDKDARLCAALPSGRCVNLVGKTTVVELLALCHLARALVSNDCGLPHLASLTPVRRIVLFGPESPSVFSPVGKETRTMDAGYPCAPCLSALNHRQSACRDNRCLQAIPVEAVYQAVMSTSSTPGVGQVQEGI